MIVGYDSKGREIDALEAMHRQENLVVNVAMDNAAAMMFDIFKQAGKELVEEA